MNRIDEVKELMETNFLNAVHQLCQAGNPGLYMLYNGNCCRQTATFGHFILQKELPDYEWEMWEGEFTDKIDGRDVRYEHAWNYGKYKGKGKRKDLFVDMGRNFQDRFFIETNKNRYPSNAPGYEYTKLLNKRRINPNKNLQIEELYTSLLGKDFLEKLEGMIYHD